MPKGKSHEKAKRRRVTLSLDAPQAKEVSLVGDFNHWSAKAHPMKKNESGVWKKTVMLQPGRYEYKLMVDGQWQNDPANQETSMNCFGTHNNVIIVSPR
jgi:1,4-alpha-glucan branching enzyme